MLQLHDLNIYSLSLLVVAGAGVVNAIPIHHDSHKESKRATTMAPLSSSDLGLLNFALTLENMENAFYSSGLAQYTPANFTASGLPSYTYGRFQQIAEHEASHVQFLQSLIGPTAVAPCNYSFPYTDPISFAAMSQTLEGVGASAYLGATNLFMDPYLMTATGSMMTTEARQATWVASLNNLTNPWSSSFDTPLSANQVASLASAFITSCPPTNPQLIAQPFPPLNVTTPNPQPGQMVTVVYDTTPSNMAIGGAGTMNPIGGYAGGNATGPGTTTQPTEYLALLSGLNTWFAPITNTGATPPPPPSGNTTTIVSPNLSAPQQITTGTAMLPPGLQGTVYAVVTTSNTTVADNGTIAGVALLQFPFDSTVNNTGGAPLPVSNTTSMSMASYSYSSYSESYSSTIVPPPVSMPISVTPAPSSSLPFVVSSLALPPPEITTILTCS